MVKPGIYPMIDTKYFSHLDVRLMDSDGISSRHYVMFLTEPVHPRPYHCEDAHKLTEVEIKRIAVV